MDCIALIVVMSLILLWNCDETLLHCTSLLWFLCETSRDSWASFLPKPFAFLLSIALNFFLLVFLSFGWCLEYLILIFKANVYYKICNLKTSYPGINLQGEVSELSAWGFSFFFFSHIVVHNFAVLTSFFRGHSSQLHYCVGSTQRIKGLDLAWAQAL